MTRALQVVAALLACSAALAQSAPAENAPASHAPASVPRTPSGVGDLPLNTVPAAPDAASPWFAILISGDGGWAALDRSVAKELAKHGIAVVGWNSRKYFWTERTPGGISADLDRVIKHYTHAWSKSHVILVGYSQGADTMPFMVNRLPEATRAEVGLTALVALSDNALFEFHVASLLGSPQRGVPIAPELENWNPASYVCIYGAEDPDAACDKLFGPQGSVVKMAGGHHFNGSYLALAHAILNRVPTLPAVHAQGN